MTSKDFSIRSERPTRQLSPHLHYHRKLFIQHRSLSVDQTGALGQKSWQSRAGFRNSISFHCLSTNFIWIFYCHNIETVLRSRSNVVRIIEITFPLFFWHEKRKAKKLYGTDSQVRILHLTPVIHGRFCNPLMHKTHQKETVRCMWLMPMLMPSAVNRLHHDMANSHFSPDGSVTGWWYEDTHTCELPIALISPGKSRKMQVGPFGGGWHHLSAMRYHQPGQLRSHKSRIGSQSPCSIPCTGQVPLFLGPNWQSLQISMEITQGLNDIYVAGNCWSNLVIPHKFLLH